MKNNSYLDVLKRQFYPSLSMMERMIHYCPIELWKKVKGGFPFWQQIFHALESMDYWFSLTNTDYIKSQSYDAVSSELGEKSIIELEKDEVKNYFIKIKIKSDHFFNNLDDIRLLSSNKKDTKRTQLDIILGQIRHIQYHVGHCNCILRENGIKAVEWIGYGEK
ncbi:MAG: hypothetical protein JW969_10495 [Spirochaetales bacterium]|nr:hypothetical protein [Spirochaetales bacterium]